MDRMDRLGGLELPRASPYISGIPVNGKCYTSCADGPIERYLDYGQSFKWD